MLKKTIFIFTLLLLTGLSVFSDSITPGSFTYPGSALWTGYSQFTIRDELRLNDNTIIKADEVILDGLIITEGFEFQIDARKLIVTPKAKIIGFDRPAPDFSPAVAEELDDAKGKDPSGCDGCHGEDGNDGIKGNAGAQGLAGHPDPKPIMIAAERIEGKLVIDGTGQTGGRGQQGGPGQKGGKGQKGGPSHARWWPWSDTPAGQGGRGGKGGEGGDGGMGGIGGKEIPIILLFGDALQAEDLAAVTSSPGQGGPGGLGGLPGKGGDHGDGGDGQGSSQWLFVPDDQDGGANGSTGPAGDKHGIAGSLGATGAELPPASNQQEFPQKIDLSELSTRTLQLRKAWYDFHLARTLVYLVQNSFTLLSQQAQWENGSSALNEIFKNLQTAQIEEIRKAWKLHFLAPIEKIQSDLPFIIRSQEVAQNVLKTLDLIESQKKLSPEISKALSNALRTSEDLYVSAFATSISQCKGVRGLQTQIASNLPEKELLDLTGTKSFSESISDEVAAQSLSMEIYFLTSAYTVPACVEIAQLGKAIDPEATISLYSKYDPYILPEGLKGDDRLKLFEFSENPIVRELAGLSLVGSAHAEDGKVVFVDGKPLQIKRVQGMEPRSYPILKDYGLPLDLRLPDRSKIKMDTLGFYLRTLSAQIEGLEK